jgi:murein DD-endopeptidase MepM/ murein hydrolase activator NlpD
VAEKIRIAGARLLVVWALGLGPGVASGAEPDALDGLWVRAETALHHGRLDQAESLLATARPLAAAAGRESAAQARLRLDLARLRRLQGQPRQARHELGLARFVTRAVHGPDSLEMAEVEIERSLQHQAAGLADEAVDAVQEALRIRRAQLPADAPLVLDTLRGLALAHHLAFQYVRAVSVYRQLLDALAQAPARRNLDRVEALNRMAWIHARAAMPERAEALRQQAREIVATQTPGGGGSERLQQVGLDVLAGLAPDHGEAVFEMRQLIDDWLAEHHYHPDHFDVEMRMLVTLRRLDRQMPVHKVRFALLRDLQADFVTFAEARPRNAGHQRYGLPFASDRPRSVLRTSEGPHGFHRVLLHAVDFAVPAGTAVLAAREGTVVRVVRGLPDEDVPEIGPEEDLRHGLRVNRIIVLHDDETYATYQPLAPEIEVEEGRRVARGDRLGRTAKLRDGTTAIVHFDVRRNGRSAGSGGVITPEPVRVRFADVGEGDGVPLPGRAYGGSVPAAAAN